MLMFIALGSEPRFFLLSPLMCKPACWNVDKVP